jgi:hypothetical protein
VTDYQLVIMNSGTSGAASRATHGNEVSKAAHQRPPIGDFRWAAMVVNTVAIGNHR